MGGIVRESNGKLAGKLALAALLMFGFGFAMVPLYDVFCEVLGRCWAAKGMTVVVPPAAAERVPV